MNLYYILAPVKVCRRARHPEGPQSNETRSKRDVKHISVTDTYDPYFAFCYLILVVHQFMIINQ